MLEDVTRLRLTPQRRARRTRRCAPSLALLRTPGISTKRGHEMGTRLLPLLAVLVLMNGGCAGTTPIKDLALPPVSTIEGTVTRIDVNGFTLTDGSGAIFVRSKLPDNKKLDLLPDEKVKVYGNLLAGQEKIFDGYVIRKPTGEQLVVSYPSPHLGFVIQSSFRQ